VAGVFLAAAPAGATIGSVISSFPIPGASRYGIYQEGNYVYLAERDMLYNYIGRYSLSGTYLSRVVIDQGNQNILLGGSRTHLGPGYVALYDGYIRCLKIFSTSTGGYPVTAWSVTKDNIYNIFWDGEYYYFNQIMERGRFDRYSSTGSYVNRWACAGWPASMLYCVGAEYAERGNGGAGPYFVAGAGDAGRPYCITTFPGGSLVATWTLPAPYLTYLSYGNSSNPVLYGSAIWASTVTPYTVREIDIDARAPSTVLPVSIGKVKAIFR